MFSYLKTGQYQIVAGLGVNHGQAHNPLAHPFVIFGKHYRLSPILHTWQAKVANFIKGFALEGFTCASALSLIPWFIHGCVQGEETKSPEFLGASAITGLAYGAAFYWFYCKRIELQIKPAALYHDKYVDPQSDARFLAAEECELWADEDGPILSPEVYPIPALSPCMNYLNHMFNLLGSLLRALAAMYWTMLVFYNQDSSRVYDGCFYWPAYVYASMVIAIGIALVKHCNTLTLFIEDIMQPYCVSVWEQQLRKQQASHIESPGMIVSPSTKQSPVDFSPVKQQRLNFSGSVSTLSSVNISGGNASNESHVVSARGSINDTSTSPLVYRSPLNESSFFSAWSDHRSPESPDMKTPLATPKKIALDCVHGWGSVWNPSRGDGVMSQEEQKIIKERYATPVKLQFD